MVRLWTGWNTSATTSTEGGKNSLIAGSGRAPRDENADVSEEGIQERARLIEQQGGRALAVRCDVTRAEDVKAALDKTVEAFGRLDVAFNNAGIEPKNAAPTADYDEEEWNRIIDIDLRGVFLCMKHEIPLMLKHGGGAIVNTSSGAGVIGIKGSPAYTAVKHGVIGLTRAAAGRRRRPNGAVARRALGGQQRRRWIKRGARGMGNAHIVTWSDTSCGAGIGPDRRAVAADLHRTRHGNGGSDASHTRSRGKGDEDSNGCERHTCHGHAR
jgi:hypothetical protein